MSIDLEHEQRILKENQELILNLRRFVDTYGRDGDDPTHYFESIGLITQESISNDDGRTLMCCLATVLCDNLEVSTQYYLSRQGKVN